MAVMTDIKLFQLLESAGQRLISTKFGTLIPDDVEFGDICDKIIGLALADYVKAEYENLWETHQLRPHAYGHTWSPGYELPAGMLHGHAVGRAWATVLCSPSDVASSTQISWTESCGSSAPSNSPSGIPSWTTRSASGTRT